ncbi:FtsW/RodA/SpoVE family cell cycle protein [Dactylosporangium matsuzakiense]|uniref:Cell division protein FtsW n=1 Tax=Dactylosporangium matsuzakiense TaxID=53360 RepID=A0A9W6KGF0_9ACTN|nr:cell division protein FtsW [Dactylosporangium matsuzakiense]
MTATAIPAPPAGGGGASAPARMPTRRNVELGLLLFVIAILTIYAAVVEGNAVGEVTGDFWVQPAMIAILFGAAHLAIRFLAPYADPVILPAVALINGIGVGFLRRLDYTSPKLTPAARAELSVFGGNGFQQLGWTAVALVGAVALLFIVRDHRSLSRYPYVFGLAGIVLVLIPAVLPAQYSAIHGAKLWIKFAGFTIQPGEFAKIFLLVFFAVYLVRKREVLGLAGPRFLGLEFPRPRDLGPVVAVWLMSLMVLVFEKDLGTSLMYFGLFVVTLYVATERSSWLIIGLTLFLGGVFLAYFLGKAIGGPFLNFSERATTWLDPFGDADDKGYQLVQSLFGLGTGGLTGTGPGAGQPTKVPEVWTDFIFSGLGEEIGLFGLTALLVTYLLLVERGLRSAINVRDLFGKVFAGGLSFTLGLQVFVIVGGISQLIPLTGQTTPFLSAGGSSLVANWLLIGLLLRISDAARRPAVGTPSTGGSGPGGGGGAPVQIKEMPTEVVR